MENTSTIENFNNKISMLSIATAIMVDKYSHDENVISYIELVNQYCQSVSATIAESKDLVEETFDNFKVLTEDYTHLSNNYSKLVDDYVEALNNVKELKILMMKAEDDL